MKRALFFTFSILFLFVILFFANLNTVLNSSFFKNFLSGALKTKYHINKFSYKRVEVSLRKHFLKFTDLDVSAPKFKVFLKKVQAKVAFKKLLYLKNPLQALYIEEGTFTYIHKPFQKKQKFRILSLENVNNFFFLEPLYIKFANLNLAIKEDGKLVSVGNAEGEVRFENGQLLFDGKILNGKVLKEISLKGRFNYASSFLESSLLIKNIDFGQIPILKKIFNSTDINLQARVALEKGRFDFLFFGKAPKVVFKGLPDKIYSCTYLQGLGFSQNGTFEVKLDPVRLSFPNTEAKVSLIKTKKDYKFLVKVPLVKAEEVLPVVELFLPEKVLPYFKAAKKGVISNFEFSAKSPVLKTLFHFPNLSLKGKVKEGEYILPLFGKLPFSNFNGEILLEKGVFIVKGNTEVKGVAKILNGFFELKKDKHVKINLNCRIKGKAEKIKRFILSHWEILNPIEKYKPYGDADLLLNLSYKHPSLILYAKSLAPLKINFSQFKGVVTLAGASLHYEPKLLTFAINKALHRDFSAKTISGKVDFKESKLNFMVKKSVISKKFLQILWKPSFSKKIGYNFSKLILENLVYKGPFHFDINSLCLKGILYDLSLILKQKKVKINIKSPFVEIQEKNGIIKFHSPRVVLGKSAFEIRGAYEKGRVSLSGNGTLLEKDFRLITRALGSNSPKIGSNILVKNFYFEKKGEEFYYSGVHLLKSLKISTTFNGTAKKFVLTGSILGPYTDFNLSIQKGAIYKVNTKGTLALEELNFLFPDINIRGLITSDLSFSFETPKYKLEKILNNYLSEKQEQSKGFIEAKEVKIGFKKGINVGFDFKLKVLPWGFSLKPFVINLKKHEIKGAFSIKKRKGAFLIGGELKGDVLDLSSVKFSKKPTSQSFWNFIKKLPVSADLRIKFSKVILPSYHQIKNVDINLKYYEGGSYFVSLDKARFCTLNLKGFLDYSPEYKYIFIKILPSSGDFLDLFSCLYPKEMPRVLLEGPFEGKGFIYSDGEKSLWENPYGELIATSKKGYLYRAPLLVKVLGYLSPIDIFKGKIPNLENDLLEYDELDFKGIIKKPYFDLKEFFLSAPGFRLFGEGKIDYPWSDKRVDLTFYVSPFKTLDVILEKIPVIRRLLGKTRMFIYLPVQVVGTYEHPKIIPLHPESVGKGISEFFLRFLGLSPEPLSNSKETKILEKIEKKLPH